MTDYSLFNFEEADVINTQSPVSSRDWRMLRRLSLPNTLNDPQSGPIKRALVLDVEATGLSTEDDDVTQLAMLPFEYEVQSGRIITVHNEEAFEGLREPSVPISKEATFVTGITDDMVTGKSIDDDVVNKTVANADLIIAHNAAFDRPMVEKIWPCFEEKPWACTFDSIDWLAEGFTAGKLDYLGTQFGWFYDGHRALADCEACLALLSQTLPKSERSIMTEVREVALKKKYLIRAVDAPFEQRDALKSRAYRWRGAELKNGKVWWTIVDDPAAETAWLQDAVYGRHANIPVHPITALQRYSPRMWAL
jgi:DNA polymerase-3 subunit epsilon